MHGGRRLLSPRAACPSCDLTSAARPSAEILRVPPSLAPKGHEACFRLVHTFSTLVAFSAGASLIALMLQDAFEVMLLPRRVHRRWRLMGFFFHFAWALWAGIGRQIQLRSERERFLSLFGPISMVGLFSIWAVGLVAGFGLLFWSIERHRPDHYDLGSYVYLSGTTIVTLGYGDLTPHAAITKALAVAEAVTGFGLLAVVIGYLPVLYQLFSRREAHVMQLDGRAGSPPTAGALLGRHASNQALHKLDDLLLDWERWCAELVESHLSVIPC